MKYYNCFGEKPHSKIAIYLIVLLKNNAFAIDRSFTFSVSMCSKIKIFVKL